MSKLFHLPLTIFWAPVRTGNSLSFELNAAGGLPGIFCGWELSLDTHCRVVRRKFKQRLHDQTQKLVQDTTGHSALLICHLAQCSPGAWEGLHGAKNQNELCSLSLWIFHTCPIPEILCSILPGHPRVPMGRQLWRMWGSGQAAEVVAIQRYDFDPSFPHLRDKGRKEQDSPSHLRPPEVVPRSAVWWSIHQMTSQGVCLSSCWLLCCRAG